MCICMCMCVCVCMHVRLVDLQVRMRMPTCAYPHMQVLGRRPGEDTPSLQKVCARTIGRRLDKTQQCSKWSRRPLEREQFLYAALDAHILLDVHEALVLAAC